MRLPRVGERDYRLIWIRWQANTFLSLGGRIDIGAEWEGEYDQLTDTGAVTSNNAEFGHNENDGSGAMSESWIGRPRFIVKITRTFD